MPTTTERVEPSRPVLPPMLRDRLRNVIRSAGLRHQEYFCLWEHIQGRDVTVIARMLPGTPGMVGALLMHGREKVSLYRSEIYEVLLSGAMHMCSTIRNSMGGSGGSGGPSMREPSPEAADVADRWLVYILGDRA